MTITELFDMTEINNGVIDLECFFVAKKDRAFLVDNLESINYVIDVSDSGLWESLNEVVSPFGGGEWDFYDKCFIKAIFNKEGDTFTLGEVFRFGISRYNVNYITVPITDVQGIKSNIKELIEESSSSVISENELIGYLVLNSGGVTLNLTPLLDSPENKSVKVSIPNVEDIIEDNFLPDDKWPDYEAFVKVSGNLELSSDGVFELVSAKKWEVMYPNVTIHFEGLGKGESYL